MLTFRPCSQQCILTYKADIRAHATKQNEKNINGKKYNRI